MIGRRQTLTIPMILPNLNDLLTSASKGDVHRRYRSTFNGYHQIKTQYGADLVLYIRKANVQPVARAIVHFTWIELNRMRDPDNVSGAGRKLILDALVDAGILPNDGWAHVAGLTDTFCVDRAAAGVRVELEEVA